MSTTICIWDDADPDLSRDLQDQLSDMVYRLFYGAKSSFRDGQLLNKTEDAIINKMNSDIPAVVTEMKDMERESLLTQAQLVSLDKSNGKISALMQVVTSEGIEKDVRIEI